MHHNTHYTRTRTHTHTLHVHHMYGNLHTGANDETYRDLCVCISNRATEAREAEVELHKMRKVVLRMQRVKVAATMNAWIEFYQERKNNKMLLTRAARKMQSRALASSWEGWIDFVESRYHTRNVVRRVFGNLTNRVVGLAFYSWTELVGDHIRQQLLIARCAAKIKNRCVAGAFERWVDDVEETKEMRVAQEHLAETEDLHKKVSREPDRESECCVW